MTWFRVRQYLFSSLWFVPVLCVLGGAALSFATIAIDRKFGSSLIPRSLAGDPEAALGILTTVAASMVTLTGLVLTITMVVVQLAIGQFSPRVLRAILHDRPSQIAIGVFVATFAHSIFVMREVRAANGDDKGYVPGLAIIVAFFLILVSIIVLVAYVNHIGQSLRVSSIINTVGDETRELLAKQYPRAAAQEPADAPHDVPSGEPAQLIAASKPGILYRVDTDKLVDDARDADVTVVLLLQLGDFVPEGATVAEVYGPGRLDEKRLFRAVALGRERTMHQDVAFGIRMLIDVAVRSSSQSIVDPTTTTQAIDRVHDSLRQLATRPFHSGRHFDAEGQLRVVVPQISWEAYVNLALDELRQFAGASPQVTRRLQAMLEDLVAVAPAERRAPLEEQLELLRSLAERSFEDRRDVAAATVPDVQGIGAAPDGVPEGRTESKAEQAAR